MEPPCVLDASALLATMRDEDGAHIVDRHMPSACVSSVNISEVAAKLIDGGMPASAVTDVLTSMKLDIRDFDLSQALYAGRLRAETRPFGLSLGDRACLALAAALGLPVLTTDRAWTRLDISVEVRLVR